MLRRALAIAGCTLLLAGCDAFGISTAGPEEVLDETADNMAELTSGELGLSLTASGGNPESPTDEVGFTLSGPFALPEAEGLPLADLVYTRIQGTQRFETRFISTGEAAFVETNGTTYELPPEQLVGLQGSADTEAANLLADVRISDWVVDPELQEDAPVQGDDEVDRVSGDLDVVAVVNDLLEIAGSFGTAAPTPLDGEDAEQLRNAVQAASIEVLTGSQDRILRRVTIDVDFGLDPAVPALSGIADLIGATILLELTIENPNEEVEVVPPADAIPLEELTPSG